MEQIASTVNLQESRLATDFKYFSGWSGPDPLTEQDIRITPEHLNLVLMLMTGKDGVVVCYRGFGKSTIVTYKYALRRSTQHHKSVIIFSANEDLAVDKLRIIKTALEVFPQLQRFCGKGIYTWNDKEIWLTDRTRGREGPDGKMVYPVISRIKALGFESRFRGVHADIILADDIVIEENSLTPEGRPDLDKIEKVKRDFDAKVIPIRNPGGSIVLVGTPQYINQLNMKESDILTTWQHKKNVKAYVLPALTEYGEPTCPGLHSKEFLLQQKEIVRPNEWNKEYMLNPTISGETIIADDILDRCKDSRRYYTIDYIGGVNEIVLLGTDYVYEHDKAKAEANKLAYFALVPIAYDIKTNKRKVLNVHYERGVTFTEQIEKTIKFLRDYHCNALCLELHGGLKLFEPDLRRLAPPHVSIFDAGNKSNKFDTISGLPSLEYLFKESLIDFAYRDKDDQAKTEFMLYEIKQMKSAGHVDCIDALLRVDTIIRKHYYVGTNDPNFSVRTLIDTSEYKLTALDNDMLSVFGKPDQKRLDEYQKQKSEEMRIKELSQRRGYSTNILLERTI